MPSATVNSVSLHYEERGSGPAVLFIHGSGDFSHFFADTVAELGEDLRAIVYDRRGFARSSGARAARLEQHVEDAAALLRHLDAGSATVVGSSAGGVIALGLAVEHPELVKSLVLSEPTYQPGRVWAPSAVSALARTQLRRIVLRDEEGAALDFYRWVTAYRNGGCQVDRFPDDWTRTGAEHAGAALQEVMRLLVHPWPRGSALRRISSPVTVLAGDLGQPLFRKTTDRARRFMPYSTLVRVPGTAHLLAVDQPARLAQVAADSATGHQHRRSLLRAEHADRHAAAPTVHVTEQTNASPQQVLAAARDFSEQRAELWPDVHLEHFEVHRTGEGFADVTEGNREPFGYIWERLQYDWSHPGSVRGTVTDSNIFRPGSTWEIKAAPLNGGSRVEIVGVRDVKGFKGALIGGLIRTGIAKRVVAGQLRHFLSKVEESRA